VLSEKGVSIELPSRWTVDPKNGRFIVPEPDRSRISGALISEEARDTLAGFLKALEPSITSAQMHRISLQTKRVGSGDQTDVEYGRGASAPKITVSGLITTSGPRSILAFCGSTPERRPTGAVVCAPILASLHTGPTDGKSQSGEERVTGDGWSVVLPAGW
jgi:hypothetical protein